VGKELEGCWGYSRLEETQWEGDVGMWGGGYGRAMRSTNMSHPVCWVVEVKNLKETARVTKLQVRDLSWGGGEVEKTEEGGVGGGEVRSQKLESNKVVCKK
jgi:hypothetical protein